MSGGGARCQLGRLTPWTAACGRSGGPGAIPGYPIGYYRVEEERLGIASGSVPAYRPRNRHLEVVEGFWRRVRSILEMIVEDVIRTAEDWPFWGTEEAKGESNQCGQVQRALGGGGVTRRSRLYVRTYAHASETALDYAISKTSYIFF